MTVANFEVSSREDRGLPLFEVPFVRTDAWHPFCSSGSLMNRASGLYCTDD